MKRFYEFLKSPQAPVFALATMILTFFQMYGKLYYHHNPYALHPILDVIIALVAAGGLSTITFIIIIHSKKRWMPIFFAGLDFVGGLLFYGRDILAYYEAGAFIDIGSALFIPFFKASAIYFVGEIFLDEVNEKQKDHLAEKAEELKELATEHQNQSRQLDNLKAELAQTQERLTHLNDESQEWKRKSYKYDITNIKRSLYSTRDKEKIKQKKEELAELEELLAATVENKHGHKNQNGYSHRLNGHAH